MRGSAFIERNGGEMWACRRGKGDKTVVVVICINVACDVIQEIMIMIDC